MPKFLLIIESRSDSDLFAFPDQEQGFACRTSMSRHRGNARLPAIVALFVGIVLGISGKLFLPDIARTARDHDISAVSVVPQPPARLHEPFQPLPDSIALDPDRVSLGSKLFHDPRLSADGTIACASCHNLDKGGDDGRPHSIGINGQEGDMNAPTVLNSGLNFRQFWNGRANTLEDQIDGPITNSKEMASSWSQILDYLKNDETYRQRFAKVFGQTPNVDLVKSAIATFERSLITPARFDRWLRGDDSALTADERKGYELFKDYRCGSCHSGENFGGNMFQKLGAMEQYFGEGRELKQSDYGRFTVTGKEYDRFVFRVPSLRNVGETAPYFHDGSVSELEDAVRIMIKYQLGREVDPVDVKLISAFLRTLSRETAVKVTLQNDK